MKSANMIFQDDTLSLFNTCVSIPVLYASAGCFISDTGIRLGNEVLMLKTPHAKYGYRSEFKYVDQFDEDDQLIARYNLTFYGAILDEEFMRTFK